MKNTLPPSFNGILYAIKPHARIGPELKEVARKEIGQIIAGLRALNADTLDGLAHQIRQRLKGLRAVVRLLREPLGKARYRQEDEVLRAVGRTLGPLREGQAALTTLDSLQRRFFPGKPPAALRVLREKLDVQTQGFARALVDAADATRQIAALEGVQERLATWPVDGYSWKEMEHAVGDSYRCSKAHYEHAHGASDADSLHCWRKRANDLWQYLRMLRRTAPGLTGELAHEYEVLGEFLGDYHDLVVLRAALEKQGNVLLDRRARETFVKLLDLRRDELYEAATSLGKRLHASSPAAFARDLGEHRTDCRERFRRARKLGKRFSVRDILPLLLPGQTPRHPAGVAAA